MKPNEIDGWIAFAETVTETVDQLSDRLSDGMTVFRSLQFTINGANVGVFVCASKGDTPKDFLRFIEEVLNERATKKADEAP